MAVPPPPTFEEFGNNIFATPPRKPTLERRGAVAETEKKEAEVKEAEATLPTTVFTNEAGEGYIWIDPSRPGLGVRPKPGYKKTDKSGQAEERKNRIKASLKALQRVRKLAEERLAIGSASEFLQNVPLINQNRRNIETAINNAESGIISDMVTKLAEINQGGVTGMANTPAEARRLGAQIADLNPNQDLPSLLEQAKLAETYYLQQAAALEGKEAVDQDILTMYLPESRLLELSATEPSAKQLSEDGTEMVEIPDWYQQSHLRYLIDNKDNLDPSQYAAFRADLDEKAGLEPNIDAYVNFATDAREFFRQGGAPQQLGIVPPAERDISAFSQGMTQFAQNPVGAGTLAAITSATAGLPVALAGGQEKMEAVRQNQPVATLIGDVIGGALGTKGLGTTTRIAGLSDNFLANPVLQDAAFNIVSGATQAEDPLVGAASGLVTSLIGEYAGRAAGRAMPGTFAPRSTREARESVPTTGELGEEADFLYRRAAAQGQMMDAPAVDAFIDDTEQFMRSSGLMDQQGNVLGTGPVQDAYRLLSSFRGQPINPIEAQTIRKKIAEGRTAMRDGAPDNTARMFSGELTDRFDDFAEAAMPGIAEAREVAQRRIVARELERARELGQARGDINYTQGGADLGIRRAYGNLDTAEIRGTRMYPEGVSEAIEVVSRGTPGRNIAQGLGRLSPQGGTGRSGGILAGIGLGSMVGDAATGGLLTGGMYGLGLAGRSLASAGTRRDAELAELIARGGPAFQAMLDSAREEAAFRAGRLGAGAFGAAGIRPFMDADFSEETPTSIALEDLSARYPEQPAKVVPPTKEGFTNVTSGGDEVQAPVQTTRIVDGRLTDIDPVTGVRIFIDTGEPVTEKRKAMQRGGAVKGYKEGGQKKQTSWYDDMLMAASRRGNDLVAAAADLADKYGITPADAVAWVAKNVEGRSPQEVARIRQNLSPLGSNRAIVEAGAASNERRFREAGGRGARSEDEVMPPARLSAAAYRPQDVPRAVISETPKMASAVADYFAKSTPSSLLRDAQQGITSGVEAFANDPYGMVFDSMLYAAPQTALAAAPFDYAGMRESSKMLADVARDPYVDEGTRADLRNTQRMVDALGVLPLTAPLGPAAAMRKTPRRKKTGGLAVKRKAK